MPLGIAAFVAAAAWFVAARKQRSVGMDLAEAWDGVSHQPLLVMIVAAVSVTMAGAFATRSAAGADASGYVSEAAALSHGQLFYSDPLSDLARGHDPYLTSPLGWRPAIEGKQAPTYPPGLPLLMAIPHRIAGVTGGAWVVSMTAAIAVISTGLIALEFSGSVAALLASLLLAFAPIFIHQSIQPMSDVPVTAFWMLCFLFICRSGRENYWAAGAACAVAVLIRPNLAPLAIVPLVMSKNRIAFAMPVAIAGAALAGMQSVWYGSPLRSGYGSVEELYALSNIGENAGRYFFWLATTSPALMIAVPGFWRFKKDRDALGLLVFCALVIVSYLVYAVFDDWSYLRFLLPVVAILCIFTAIEIAAWLDRWPAPARAPALLGVVLCLLTFSLWMTQENQTFRLADQLKRVGQIAAVINDSVEPSAVIVAGEQSGSMRYYTHRPIVRWEAASPEALTAALDTLAQSQRPVYIVLDAWENEPFRAKFGSVPAVALDWPAIVEAGTSHRTRLWRVSDRERFLRGDSFNTTRLP